MAKKSTTWVQKSFVKFDLDAKQAQKCKLWQPTFDELDGLVLREVEAGYKFTFSWDNYNDCNQCSMQTDANIGENSKLILVGRGSTPLKALKQVLAKHQVCEGHWPVPDFQERHNTEFDD